jgi:hypothetical protein
MLPRPIGLPDDDEEQVVNPAFRTLFESEDDILERITETPSRMIIPMVRLRLLEAAADPKRKKSLLRIFTESFDSRMISKDRKGRIEAVDLMKNSRRSEEDGMDDIPM